MNAGERQLSGRMILVSLLSCTSKCTEQSARAMLGDLDEWQLLNQQHELSVG